MTQPAIARKNAASVRLSSISCKTRQRHFEAFPAWLQKAGVTETPLTYSKGSGQRRSRRETGPRYLLVSSALGQLQPAYMQVVPLPASHSFIICARALSTVLFDPSLPQSAHTLPCCALKEQACLAVCDCCFQHPFRALSSPLYPETPCCVTGGVMMPVLWEGPCGRADHKSADQCIQEL